MALQLLENCESVNNPDKILLTVKSTVRKAFVEKFSEGSERPCDKTDFNETKKIREEFTSDLKLQIESFVLECSKNDCINKSSYFDFDNELLALIIILCGQNNTLQPWNTEVVVKNCYALHSQILKYFGCRKIEELLSKSSKINLTKNVLLLLCADLTVETWKHYPASVDCYKWFLNLIKQPELSKYLQFVLPPALLLIDDFVSENRIVGAQCLNHIINNITIAELQLCGYGEVIYNALLPLLRTREADVICSTITPVVSITCKLEFDLGKKQNSKWSKFDTILEIFLENMELEQMTELRNIYISGLHFLVSAAESNIIRWSKRLLRIFDEYIQISAKNMNVETLNHTVKTIEKYIEVSSHVTNLYAKQLLCVLLMTLHSTNSYDGNDDTDSNKKMHKENKEITVRCIKKLMESLGEIEKKELKEKLEKNFRSNVTFYKYYEQIIQLLNTD